jgi:thiamine biosynthesis lipoprotein
MEYKSENIAKFPVIVQEQFKELGTDIDIQIVAENESALNLAKKDIEKIRKLYLEFTDIFSRFRNDSELSRLNDSLGQFSEASIHMQKIVELSLEFNKETDSFYDPRVLDVLEKVGYADDFKSGTRKLREDFSQKSFSFDHELSDDLKLKDGEVFFGVRLDFSGIAKGYITDQIVEFVLSQGWKNFLIDSGGDMFAHGVDEQGKIWTVAVEGIDEKKLVFGLSNKAIATSGIGRRRWEVDGQRIHHIINPKRPEDFSFDLKSVSVIADSTTSSDVWAKTIFLMGKVNGMMYVRENDLAAVILDYRGAAWISPRAKEFLY